MIVKRLVFLMAVAACILSCLSVVAAPKVVQVKIRVDSENAGYEGFRAMDGNPGSMWHTDFSFAETGHPHEIIIDLGASYEIGGFTYLPRPGASNGTIKEFECYVSDDNKEFGEPVVKGTMPPGDSEHAIIFPARVKGRYVRLRALSEVAGRAWTSIAELKLLVDGVQFRAKSSTAFDLVLPDGELKDELDMQYAALVYDFRNRAKFARVAHQAHNEQALILASDRDPLDVVLRRTVALLENLQALPGTPDLARLEKELVQLHKAGDEIDVDAENIEARLKLFKKVCQLRRKIAFSNPLLDFDEILFIKRHRPGFNHMCDQYYGINARPGGSVCVLRNPFGDEAEVRDVLADSVVERGRLEGQRLEGGSFVSPDLSYDGKTIVFAYVQCQGDRGHRRHTDPSQGHWDEGWSYHVFRVNVDGSGLEQLTDGTWNDFDPCWLPNGRLAFITERRGGYLRCGRTCPTYTLFDMAADGSDIRCLSFHETNEWHPSVTHDGRIIYTRWDYIDRHGCTAHMPWVTTLDGRDSRAVHGNFSPRNSRPDMELDIRAVPHSQQFVGTAAPHHGQAFGSLILFDPRVQDDDQMAPVRRVTPEVAFPESQGGAQVYGTPWALSEDYYLCVYDVTMTPNMGRQGQGYQPGNYGIYLVDAFGSKELIYRDRGISCLSPIPLRPLAAPPAMPDAVVDYRSGRPFCTPVDSAGEEPPDATVSVIDVYDSLRPWPENTKITELRVVQVLPMTVPSGGPPHEIGMRLPTAGDSVVPARHVLGTVPVETDGSAHFTVPAHKEMFFQALDERGLAVQSMRSATYLQAGERLVCMGCHEPKHRSPAILNETPLALLRSPSTIEPDVDGSIPFSYPRLVQPVLDRHCVECHEKEKAINLGREPIQRKWYASYVSLVPKYAFARYGESLRTMPGNFGAHASRLLEILDEGHYDVKLSEEELHRITLWLDCTSVFYGVYEKEGGEAQLRGEIVQPTLE